MKKTELSGDEIIETLAKTGSKEWNESLSSRLESVRNYLKQDEWQKGISIFIRATQGGAMQKMLGQSQTKEASDYLRGFISALQLVLSIPASIDTAITEQVNKKEKGPSGSAGY